MSELVLASIADDSNPRPWSADCPIKTRPLGRESADCLRPHYTPAADHTNLELSGPIPRTGFVRGFCPRDGQSQLISRERFRGLVQSDLVVRGLVHLLAFAPFLHAYRSNSPNFNSSSFKPNILHMHMLCT
ncbi:hypothetical protein F2Q69_00041492 [Brassica cretica]|uniref:Uncharacterized protein n=1 Tax=Brassica cretica TaxID=69181 RepID=A0A8S9N298_BRACR|nr:hypothetical protein F2Q69_00041492 [Brassica cretica]